MKIIPYRELPKKEDLLPLMCIAFNWPFVPEKFEEIASIDPRLKNSPIGFAAVENGKIVGFVGVMDLKTRNIKGEIEPAGGVWGVATFPSHVRKGIATSLLKKSHEYFNQKGYKFAFLFTASSMIAYNLYKKLGYKKAKELPSAYKLIKRKGKKARKRNRKINWKRISEIYNKFVENKTGFVVRDEKYFKMLEKREKIKPEMVLIKKDGYVIFREKEEAISIVEIAANTSKEAESLIHSLEETEKAVIHDGFVFDERILKTYKSLGYSICKRSYYLLMVKPLTKNASFNETYGKSFHLTLLDLF